MIFHQLTDTTKAACLTATRQCGRRNSSRYLKGCRILSWSDRKGISHAAKCFCVKTGVTGFEWNYKLIVCFARYFEIDSDVTCEDY
jgi:hypothetical protein